MSQQTQACTRDSAAITGLCSPACYTLSQVVLQERLDAKALEFADRRAVEAEEDIIRMEVLPLLHTAAYVMLLLSAALAPLAQVLANSCCNIRDTMCKPQQQQQQQL